ncbi:MAG: nuclear transport factor 2 family protein [Verrucomicrobiia bacterium]
MTITKQWAEPFARDWVEAWNAHDLERILSHYTDDFEMSSPFIAQFIGEASGLLAGKARVSAYWQAALQKVPNLHFDLQSVLVGSSSIVIYYRTSFGRRAAEVLYLDQAGLVHQAAAHYVDDAPERR